MALDILNIEPNKISRNLKGRYLAIYSKEKMGKTTFAAQNPKTLLLAFEIGYKNLDGVKAATMDSWATFLTAIRQLRKPEAKEMYDCIAIDTVGEAWKACERFICSQNKVSKIGDVPYGGGYVALRDEFERQLREITLMGYGLILISHSEVKKVVLDDETVIEKVSPSMPPRAAEIMNRLVDIIGYIEPTWEKGDDGEPVLKRTLVTRATPTIVAGSRLKYLEPRIPFGYDELLDAINSAIDKEEAQGATIVANDAVVEKEKIDFDSLKVEAKELWENILKKNEKYIVMLTDKVVEIFGNAIKLSEVEEDQAELMNLMVMDMREILKSLS